MYNGGATRPAFITRRLSCAALRVCLHDLFFFCVCVRVCRSVVYQQSSKESATLQPFFTLQLDIQSEKIRTVQEALETMVARESVQGYTTKTKQEVRTHVAVQSSHV